MTMSQQQILETKLRKRIAATSGAYGVIEPNDKILVAVSGGKDSYCLAYLMNLLKTKLPFKIELYAVHVSQGQPGFDPTPLRLWLEDSGIPFEIVEQDTYSIVKRNITEGQTACSVCARMRRGILYSTAEKLGCNKIALGHHREDTLATFMMNLFYCGKLQAMPAKYRTDDGRFHVIRPMVEIAEQDLISLSTMLNFPIIPCGLCSGQENHKRKKMNQMLDQLEVEHPRVKQTMMGSLKNISQTHLLDLKE